MLRGFASSQAHKKASALLSAQLHAAHFSFSQSQRFGWAFFVCLWVISWINCSARAHLGVPAQIPPVPPRQSSGSSLPSSSSTEIKRENPESDTHVILFFINLNRLNSKKNGGKEKEEDVKPDEIKISGETRQQK